MTDDPDPTTSLPGPAPTLDGIRRQVVDLLSRAAHMRQPAPAGDAARSGPAAENATEPIDFAEFLVSILAEVAANRGMTALLEGRTSSWATDAVERLLIGAGCEEPTSLAEHRSAPIVIDVPIDYLLHELGELVDVPGKPGSQCWQPLLADGEDYEGQLMALDDAHGETAQALAARHKGRPYTQDWEREEDAQQQVFDAEHEALRRRWTARYTRYLEAFRATVAERVTELGLTVPVEVHGDTDPESRTDPDAMNDRWEADPLAAQIYEYAVHNTPTSPLTTDPPEGHSFQQRSSDRGQASGTSGSQTLHRR